ncbi:TonB-dependent receptor domain-containing protein [Spongiimicrobium salis]|uniref:TonB-dependent receptor domain-containing protein n=1 Tax=Spongiimicrobium salis TaxID=1667022 RepID=UPI00374DD60A
MKYSYSYFLCILFGVQHLCSQISGTIVDHQQNPIAFANVQLLDADTQVLQTGTISDEQGNFIVNFEDKGTFFIRVGLLSYSDWNSPVFNIAEADFSLDLATIVLQEEVTALEGVAVTAQRKVIQRTQEGTVINVQESILTQGSTALQLLERSPGVILDQRNGSFSLNGKSGTLVMINGKVQRIPTADLIRLLNGMSANTIEKIELLTNPSVRYDVDGNAGIINIVLSKNERLGLRGNLDSSIGYGEGPKQTTGINLNYGGERNSWYGSYTYSYDDSSDGFIGIGSTEIEALGGNTFIDFRNRRRQINRNHMFNLGYEQQLSKTTVLGGNLLLNYGKPLVNIDNRGLYDFEVDPFLEAEIHLNGDGSTRNNTLGAYAEIQREQMNLSIHADYINYSTKNPNIVQSDYFNALGEVIQPDGDIYNNGNRGINETNIDVGVLQLDYAYTLSEEATVETGIKGSLSKTRNDARIEILQGNAFVPDNRFISTIANTEKIGAIYALTEYSISKKLSTQIGLRYEYWNQDFNDANLNRSFGRLFPSLFLTHTLSDTTALNWVYHKRITRPNYADLASFLTYNSPTSVFSGNPRLLPAITDNLGLTYTNKGFSLSLMASHEQNPIARFQITRNAQSNVAVIAPVNLDFQQSLDLQSNIPIRFNHWWNMNFNGTLGLRRFKLLHTEEQLTHNYIHYNFNANHNLQLAAGFSVELSGWYTSNHFNGTGRIKGFGSLNFGLRKDFKNGGSLQFSITDLFQSVDIKSQVGTLTREAFGDEFDVEYSAESGFSRIYRIGYSYSFGNKKVKESRTKSGAASEKSRLQ